MARLLLLLLLRTLVLFLHRAASASCCASILLLLLLHRTTSTSYRGSVMLLHRADFAPLKPPSLSRASAPPNHQISIEAPSKYVISLARIMRPYRSWIIRRKDHIGHELYEMEKTYKYGEDSSTFHKVDPDVWLQASGSNKRGRVLGTGHSLDIGIQDPRRNLSLEVEGSSSARPVTHSDVIKAINSALPVVLNNVWVAVLNDAFSNFVQSQLMPMLSMIPGYKLSNVASPSRSTNEENQQNCDEDNIDYFTLHILGCS